jgi:hypothetical protein
MNTHSLNSTFIARNYDPGFYVTGTYCSYLPPVSFISALVSSSCHQFFKEKHLFVSYNSYLRFHFCALYASLPTS